MRMTAIEKPGGLKLKLAYWYTKKKIGKVMTPLKVVYARVPKIMTLGQAMAKFSEKGLRLSPEMRTLVQTLGAHRNGCSFCVDIAESFVARDAELLAKVRKVTQYETDPRFTEAERVALRYVDEATQHVHVKDETYAALKQHWSDELICEITLVNAIENFYNRINGPLEIESDGLCAIALGNPDTVKAQTVA